MVLSCGLSYGLSCGCLVIVLCLSCVMGPHRTPSAWVRYGGLLAAARCAQALPAAAGCARKLFATAGHTWRLLAAAGSFRMHMETAGSRRMHPEAAVSCQMHLEAATICQMRPEAAGSCRMHLDHSLTRLTYKDSSSATYSRQMNVATQVPRAAAQLQF